MSTSARRTGTSALAESLDISDESYEVAAARYSDIGQWLNDKTKSGSAQYKPRIFPQGSFRLGTATRPPAGEDYDLDLVCTLQEGISPATHSQQHLKRLVGTDLEAYRRARGIHDQLEPKHRCWRLNYKDAVNFHIDTLPSVPHDEKTRVQLRESMVKAGVLENLARRISEDAIAITDDRHPSYTLVSPAWNLSNPEGYAVWFESRMRQAAGLLESRARLFKVASIEKLPVYRWRTPLQQAVQMLKKHRDIMFKNAQDRKPISIIITTLAAHAYQGEDDVQDALDRVLREMDRYVRPSNPRVPNPVNPAEDFADRWYTPEGRALQLEQNFFAWLTQARVDFGHVAGARDRAFLEDQSLKKFGTRLKESAVAGLFTNTQAPGPRPTVHRIEEAPKPWAMK